MIASASASTIFTLSWGRTTSINLNCYYKSEITLKIKQVVPNGGRELYYLKEKYKFKIIAMVLKARKSINPSLIYAHCKKYAEMAFFHIKNVSLSLPAVFSPCENRVARSLFKKKHIRKQKQLQSILKKKRTIKKICIFTLISWCMLRKT